MNMDLYFDLDLKDAVFTLPTSVFHIRSTKETEADKEANTISLVGSGTHSPKMQSSGDSGVKHTAH